MTASKKRTLPRFAGAILALLIASSLYMFVYEPEYRGSVNWPEQPLLIAHRGFGNHAPDNSAAAVELAIESGMDGVDLDTQLTADGQLVIFHDPTVDRLTNGTGKVADMPLEALQTLDAGVKFSDEFAGEGIKTLDEMIEQVDGRLILVVELKSGGIDSGGIERNAVDAIQKHSAHSYVYLSSFNPFVLRRLKQIDPRIRTVFIFRDIEPHDPTQFAKIPFFLKNEFCRRAIRKIIRPDFLSVETTVHPGTIQILRAKGYPFILWTPNDEDELRSSLQMQPLAVITDEPELAKSVMQSL